MNPGHRTSLLMVALAFASCAAPQRGPLPCPGALKEVPPWVQKMRELAPTGVYGIGVAEATETVGVGDIANRRAHQMAVKRAQTFVLQALEPHHTQREGSKAFALVVAQEVVGVSKPREVQSVQLTDEQCSLYVLYTYDKKTLLEKVIEVAQRENVDEQLFGLYESIPKTEKLVAEIEDQLRY